MNQLHRLAIAAGFGLALLAPGVANAHTPTVVPGAPCSHVGDKGTHGNQVYRCEKRQGETCGYWRWQYDGSVPKSGRTAWPHPTCPCVSATPTASPTPSHSPTTAPSPSASTAASPIRSMAPSKSVGNAAPATAPTTAGAGELPVTGFNPWPLVLAGLALIGGGVLSLLAARRRNRTTV